MSVHNSLSYVYLYILRMRKLKKLLRYDHKIRTLTTKFAL